MKKTKSAGAGHFCIVAVFIIGNSLISLPVSGGISGAVYGLAAAFAAGLILCGVYTRVQRNTSGLMLADACESRAGKIFGRTVCILFCIYALFCAVFCMRGFLNFNNAFILPQKSGAAPGILFTLLVLALCRCKKRVIIKLSVLAFALTVMAEIILFIVSLSQMQLENLLPLVPQRAEDVWYQSLSYFALSFSQAVILMAFFSGYTDSERTVTYWAGFICGAGLLLLCLVHTLAVFGYSFAGTLHFPYAYALSIVSFGDKYTRMEGISYLIYFFCCLIKTSVCIIAARDLLKNLSGRLDKHLPLIFCIVVFFFSAFNYAFPGTESGKAAVWFAAPAIVIPVILLILSSKIHTQGRRSTR